MPDRELHCERCGGVIQTKNNLVVTARMFRFAAYHKGCISQAMKAGDYTGRPVNTPAANIALAIILIAALYFYLTTGDLLVLLVLIISPIYRFMVWYKFERLLT